MTKTRIIIIEDERAFISKFKLLLKYIGIDCQVIYYLNSEDFIKRYIPRLEDHIFLNLNLKGSSLDGLQLGKHVRGEMNFKGNVSVISTSGGAYKYSGSEKDWLDKNEIEVAKLIGLNTWIVKGGMELADSLRLYFIDSRKGLTEFKKYDRA